MRVAALGGQMELNEARRAFGKRLASLREETYQTQAQLGQQLGVTGTCVWNWERGKSFPRPSALNKLAHALGTSVKYLSSGFGSPKAAQPNGAAPDRSLADVIMGARMSVAIAAGVPVNNVRVVLDCGD